MEYNVTVTAEWRSQHTFVFENTDDAIDFKDKVNSGDLDAIVDEGDIDASCADLVDFHAGIVKERGK